MSDPTESLLAERRDRFARLLGRDLQEPARDESPLASEARAHLLEDGRDLYWNELEWEHLMEEEAVDQGEPLIELMFPGVLAYVRGLLLTQVNPDALAPAEPRPQVVEDLLAFLGGRVLELRDALGTGDAEDATRLRAELRATDRLVDLVLFQYHGLDKDEMDRLERAEAG
ncbi:MAG TPA: hypothetical protein VK858_03850 [Longimicrobiales bacterium]|nr:hypothetical protein [Longimicrobiales bacterium]